MFGCVKRDPNGEMGIVFGSELLELVLTVYKCLHLHFLIHKCMRACVSCFDWGVASVS